MFNSRFDFLKNDKFGFTLKKNTGHAVKFVDQHRTAFTLAEVLITLGVIGVVAALTLPTLMTKFEKAQNLNRLKQTYSLIIQGLEAEASFQGADNMHQWSCDATVDGITYQFEGCFHSAIKRIARKMFPNVANDPAPCNEGGNIKTMRYINDTSVNWGTTVNTDACWSATISNGACVAWCQYSWAGDGRGLVFVDVDGPYKGQNKFGRDVYEYLYLTANHGRGIGGSHRILVPFGMYNVANDGTIESFKNRMDIKTGCYSKGVACSALIMYDSWQMLPDYPW